MDRSVRLVWIVAAAAEAAAIARALLDAAPVPRSGDRAALAAAHLSQRPAS